MLNKIASETTQIKQDTDIGVGEKKFSFTLCFFGWSDDINMKWIDRRNSHLILYVQEPTYMMDFKTERYNEVYMCVYVCVCVNMYICHLNEKDPGASKRRRAIRRTVRIRADVW